MAIQKWVSVIRLLIPDCQKPAQDSIIFVDVSESRYLIPRNKDSAQNDVIVNRKYLAELFNLLSANESQVRYVLCDVLFNITTPDDSALIQSISGIKGKFLGIDEYKDGGLNKNLIGARSANASVYLQNNVVYKIPFFGRYGDALVPFKMYEDLDKGKIRKNFLFTWFSGKGIAFNHQINNYPIRSSDFTDRTYVKIGLGELVSGLKLYPDTVFSWHLQNRFILIGDFDDLHDTYLNDQPGPIILFNAYLHLHLNRQILPVWYLILFYIFLYWIVWLQAEGKKNRLFKFPLKLKYFEPFVIIVEILYDSFLLLTFTILSSLLFNVNLSIFHLITVFSVVDFVKFIWKKRIRANQ